LAFVGGIVGSFARWRFGGCIHQRMWKADFGSVDGAVAGGFDEGEVFGVLGV